jgi:stage II sporulation protein D
VRPLHAVPVLAGLTTLLATCSPRESTVALPAPSAGQPELRIGLGAGVAKLEVGSDRPFLVSDAEGAVLATPLSGRWEVGRAGNGMVAGPAGDAATVRADLALIFEPATPDGGLSVNGRGYRGRVTVVRDPSGLTVVNSVALEEYLVSVVGAEMGRRDAADAEALKAQAIVSRTFALRNLGKRAAQGFDLQAGVADQVYGGTATEYPLAASAVRETAGQVLTYRGNLIDAFFFSTCAGRTATGTEVFASASRPYLHSIHDTDGAGEPYCRLSPRFRWRVEWSDAELREVLRQSLLAVPSASPEQAATVSGVTVTARTSSDRVSQITIQTASGPLAVNGPAVRQVLRPVGESGLRSALFHLAERRDNGQLRTLIADGAGAGHGVGFCQWGAVGRARAGQDAPAIVTAYFPGTEISRAY